METQSDADDIGPIHFGQCRCIDFHLGSIMNEEIIFLIDGYVHRSEYVETAIAAMLFDRHKNPKTGAINLSQAEILRRLKLYNGVNKVWRFSGDENQNASILIGDTAISNGIPSGDAVVCTISLGEDAVVEVQVNNILLNQFLNSMWDGENLTPFCRKQRRYIKDFVLVHGTFDAIDTSVVGQRYEPLDVMCDVAHAAIWTWFHGGEITGELLPRPINPKGITGGDILASYYDHMVKKMYRNDDRFQRPHRKSAAITGGKK